jgi:hypothetical protein
VRVRAVHPCRGALESKATPRDLLSALRGHTDLTAPCAEAVAKAFLAHTVHMEARAARTSAAAGSGDAPPEDASRVLSIGSLVSVDWKLGITVRSNVGDATEVPFVSLVLRTGDADGRVHSHPLHLSLSDFRTFADSLRDAAGCMDRM